MHLLLRMQNIFQYPSVWGKKAWRLPLNGRTVVVMGPFYTLTVLHIRIQQTSEQRLLGMLC